MSQKVTLGYWNIRGLAEKVRHLLEYLHIEYDQVIYTPQTAADWFEKTKPEFIKKNAAANLPYILDGDKVICETDAILVYLCHKANRLDLLGQTADDQVQIATVKGVFTDLSKAFYGNVYGPKKYEEFKQEAIKGLNTPFTKIDRLLGNNQWFCSKFSYIDIVIADFVQVYSLFNENFATEFPRLKALQQRVWGLESISAYLKTDKFKERPINWYPSAKWF